MITIEYGIMSVTTEKVYPKIFKSKEEAEKYISKRPDPSHWTVVYRVVRYSEWNQEL